MIGLKSKIFSAFIAQLALCGFANADDSFYNPPQKLKNCTIKANTVTCDAFDDSFSYLAGGASADDPNPTDYTFFAGTANHAQPEAGGDTFHYYYKNKDQTKSMDLYVSRFAPIIQLQQPQLAGNWKVDSGANNYICMSLPCPFTHTPWTPSAFDKPLKKGSSSKSQTTLPKEIMVSNDSGGPSVTLHLDDYYNDAIQLISDPTVKDGDTGVVVGTFDPSKDYMFDVQIFDPKSSLGKRNITNTTIFYSPTKTVINNFVTVNGKQYQIGGFSQSNGSLLVQAIPFNGKAPSPLKRSQQW